MSDWKNYMDENRNVFDDTEPGEGHFERFEERLNRIAVEKKRKQKLKIMFTSFSAAASVLIIIFAGIWFYSQTVTGDADVDTEFLETNGFFRMQLNEQIADIRCKLDKTDAETRTQLENDLQKIIYESDNFAKEIRNDDNKELAIYYLVEHYKANLETLQVINDKLGNYFKC